MRYVMRSEEEEMTNRLAVMGQRKKIALVAHDHKKADLLE